MSIETNNENPSKSNLEEIPENINSNRTHKDLTPDDIDKKSFAAPKKRYYLASCDENINILRKQQANELTNILINLKKEYDSIVLESKKTKNETERLEKQIEMIQKMDQKTKKYNDQSKEQNNNIKEAIEATKERLKEEEYTKKTLTSVLQKIKKDILIDERTLQNSYEKQNILKQKYHKEKLLENEIKEKQNQIYNQILKQKQKNNFDKNEFDLQIQYYNTIIEQKMMFIKSADERKERQAKIAQEAKKGSGDKEEIERRRNLQLLNLINVYLQKKMEKQIEKNKEVEEAFSKIKLICGTSNLKMMIDKMLFKDKNYNYTVKKINEQENKKKVLVKEIQELQKNFEKLKNDIIINEDTVDNKNIEVLKSKDFETSIDYGQLVDEENQLTKTFDMNKDLDNLVSLRYDQVINSIKKLCSEEFINYMKDISNVNNMSTGIVDNSTHKENVENVVNVENNENRENEENKENVENVEKNENAENQENKENAENQENDENKENVENRENNENQENEERREEENNNVENEENIENREEEKQPKENKEEEENLNVKDENIENNGSKEEVNENIIECYNPEEDQLIKQYKEYLDVAEKTFDILFLCHSQNEFLQMIRDKASEYEEANQTVKIMQKYQDKSLKSKNKSVSMMKDINMEELEFYQDDNENSKEKEIQDRIFRSYMNAERRKMEKFINNEKDDDKRGKVWEYE